MNAIDLEIHVALTFNRKFLTPFYVFCASAFKNNTDVCIHLHIVTPDLTDNDKAEMVNYVNEHAGKVSFHQPDPSQVSRLPPSNWYPPVGFYRLFLPEMLEHSGLEKIIYVDTDLLVVGSLRELDNQSTNGYPFAAVIQSSATKNRPDLGLFKDYTYFNSGVMVINIREWIKQDVTETTLKYIMAHPNLPTADQDALNVVQEGNYMPMDSRFNSIPQDIPVDLPSRKYDSFLKDKIIVHFAAHYKPWHITCNHPLRYLYFYYKNLSIRAKESNYLPYSLTPGLVYTYFRIRVKEWLNNYPALFRVMDFVYRRTLSTLATEGGYKRA